MFANGKFEMAGDPVQPELHVRRATEEIGQASLDDLHVHILEMNGESFRLRQSRKAKN